MNSPSTKALLENIIDFAGLFPPAKQSLQDAVRKYADEKNGKDSWMLGPFVLPITMLDDIRSFENLFNTNSPFKISVIGRKSQSINEYLFNFKEDLGKIQAFVQQNKEWSSVTAIETPLPVEAINQTIFEEIRIAIRHMDIRVFCEINIPSDENWREELKNTVGDISSANSVINGKEKIGIKLRTGGLTADLFPSPEQVAFVLAVCRDFGVPMKFTAGLHHPLRMYRKEVKTKMHGFLNIFVAGFLATKFNLDEESISELLSDENASHFSFEKDFLSWKNLWISSREIREIRKYSLCSFGSCSIDEPRDEFQELMKQQEVI